ncbi:hypothetical protein HDU92_000821 [Lobulomyces angularis]|nr:hypothetical protein HDU92_000821 [Lobulomyces angularis]
MGLKIVYSEKHKKHNPTREFILGRFEKYKECEKRVENILIEAKKRRLISANQQELIKPTDHGLKHILKLHSQDYVDYLKTAYKNWLRIGGSEVGVFPADFPVRDFANKHRENKGGNGGSRGYYTSGLHSVIVEGTFEAAYEAVQVALTAADILVKEDNTHVLALSRPPGHHAHGDLCGGYCFFNNAAITAKYLIDELKVGKVAILDIDYHHGNGTQEFFYSQNNPLYASIHGENDYPYYWGSASEKGTGQGLGYTINRPLKKGTKDEEYLKTLKEILENIKLNFKPNLILISLGLDTFEKDPAVMP